jgi:hypothetical protein
LLGAINLHDHARERRIFTLHPQAESTHASLVDLYSAGDAVVDRPRQIENQRVMVSGGDLGFWYQRSCAQLNADFRSFLNGDVYASNFGPRHRGFLGGSTRRQKEKNRQLSRSHHSLSSCSPGLYDCKRPDSVTPC